jgi:hypothetical protein
LSLLTGVGLALLSVTPVLAVDSCIQHPNRSKPCPHQIYKLMKLQDDKPAKITCVCMTDFTKFLTPAKGDKETVMRKMELEQLKAQLQLNEAQILSLAKR